MLPSRESVGFETHHRNPGTWRRDTRRGALLLKRSSSLVSYQG